MAADTSCWRGTGSFGRLWRSVTAHLAQMQGGALSPGHRRCPTPTVLATGWAAACAAGEPDDAAGVAKMGSLCDLCEASCEARRSEIFGLCSPHRTGWEADDHQGKGACRGNAASLPVSFLRQRRVTYYMVSRVDANRNAVIHNKQDRHYGVVRCDKITARGGRDQR